MTKKDIDFDRIARQAREFREQEERRIANEKEEEAKRIAAEKKAERERIKQAHEETLEKQQEAVESENLLFAASSFDSRGSQPSPGTVKRRREWLSQLEQDAAARRRLEEEFNAMLAARRRQHPRESKADSEAAVKAAILSASERGRRSYVDHGELIGDDDKLANPSDDSHPDDENDEIGSTSGKNLLSDFAKSTTTNETDIEMNDSSSRSTSNLLQPATSNMDMTPMEQHSERKSQSGAIASEINNELQYGAQVDPRTQAMLSEDDVIPTARATDIDAQEANYVKDRNQKTLALDNSIPINSKTFKRDQDSSEEDLNDDEGMGAEVVHKEASFELPMEFDQTGLKLSPNVADLSMMTTIPSSRLGGRLSGILEGRSSLGKNINATSGSASLQYKSSKHSRLTLGMIRGCEPFHPLITIGGRIIRHGSTIGVTFYHNAKFLHQMMLEHSLWSISFRHCFPNSKWSVSSELSRRKDLSVSLTNGNKLTGLIGWNLLKSNHFHAKIDARPKLSEHRRAHVYCHWKAMSGPSVWNFGFSTIQSLHSQIATVGLGWRLMSARGMEWIISWSRGNSTIRIPILVSRKIVSRATIGQTLYFSAVSYLIQEYIAEVWGWVGNEDNDVDDEESSGFNRTKTLSKARRDALVQKELMARQARRKMNEEREKNGLVITKAIYKADGGEEWDATVPLQFWVSQSTLTLSARPKSELLGFYDVAASLRNEKAITPEDDGGRHLDSSYFYSWVPSLSDMVYDLLDWSPQGGTTSESTSQLHIPTLVVNYEYKGLSRQTTIMDREELKLP